MEQPQTAAIKERPSKRKQFFDLLRFIVVVLAIIIPLRLLIAQPFIVSGDSMSPTLDSKNYLIVDQVSYRFHDPKRGDVIVFTPPHDPNKFYIKRIIGLPGETVTLDGTSIHIVNNEQPEGFTIDEEPYISYPVSTSQEVTLDSDEFFVMGDNRPNSSDSRFWGPLNEADVVGRAWLRLLPIKDIGLHPGDYRDFYNS